MINENEERRKKKKTTRYIKVKSPNKMRERESLKNNEKFKRAKLIAKKKDR